MRATAAFGLIALVLSTALAILGYGMVRRSLVEDRRLAAERQAFTNARLVRSGLRAPRTDVTDLLAGLQVAVDGESALRWQGRWFTSSVALDQRALPRRLVDAVDGGRAGRQTTRIAGRLAIVVGVPIREAGALYFELVPLDDVEHALRLVTSSLVIGGLVATVVAGAVGASVARAVLRPVTRMAGVARRIVGGDLESRLAADGDSDLEPLVAAFNEMLDDLRDRIRQEARFASDVTHELRGPLAALASAVEVVNRRRSELPESAVVAVDALATNVAAFNRLALDLLEISRFDAGAARLDRRPLDLAQFTRTALDALGCPDVPLRISARSSAMVSADARRLNQVLANLVQNAAHYAGGVVEAEVDASADTVRVSIEDAGPGVAEAERDAIFGRFSRGRAADLHTAPRGTGLGLALAAEHVRLHGGRIWVEDRPGGGARFIVELPKRIS